MKIHTTDTTPEFVPFTFSIDVETLEELVTLLALTNQSVHRVRTKSCLEHYKPLLPNNAEVGKIIMDLYEAIQDEVDKCLGD